MVFDAQESTITVFVLSAPYHLVDLWLHDSPEWCIEDSLRKIGNMLGNAMADQEGREVVGEVVAIMRPEVISLCSSQHLVLRH